MFIVVGEVESCELLSINFPLIPEKLEVFNVDF